MSSELITVQNLSHPLTQQESHSLIQSSPCPFTQQQSHTHAQITFYVSTQQQYYTRETSHHQHIQTHQLYTLQRQRKQIQRSRTSQATNHHRCYNFSGGQYYDVHRMDTICRYCSALHFILECNVGSTV